MKKIILLIIFIFSNSWSIFAQTCSYLAYESFNYTSQTPLDELSDGAGWSDIWDVQNGNTTVPGYHIENTSPLSFGSLQGIGNYLKGGYAWLNIGRALDTSPNGSFGNYLNNNGAIGLDSTTLWFSCMLRKDHSSNQAVYTTLSNNNIVWFPSTPNRVGFGYFGTDSDVNGNPYWSFRLDDSVYVSNEPVVIGQTAFFVMKVSFDAINGHQIDYFVNPTTLGSATPTPHLSLTTTENIEFRSLHAYLGNYPTDGGSMDEIRIGASYQCVAPDANTIVDAPPTAFINTSTTGGIAPVTVNFDGSASQDDFGIISYEWNFGDGSSDTGVTVSHIYTALGEITASLKVTDASGATHVRNISLTITDANGTYPCLSSASMLSMANCNGQNGAFRLYANDADSILFEDINGHYIAPTPLGGNNYDFLHLNEGMYSLTLSNSNGCYKQYDIHIPVDSMHCTGWTPDSCRLDFGVNLGGIAYWGRERAFKDLFKASGHLITYNSSGSSPWDTHMEDELNLDSDGYPLEIPQNTSIGLQNIRVVISAHEYIKVGDYVLLYDGTGNIDLFGGTINNQAAGRMEITINSTGNIWLHITQSQLGDHIRNIRIVRPEHENDYVSQPFYEKFLERIEPFTTLRFMDWQHTNASVNENWADRTSATYRTQAVEPGVAYEYMVQLCNIAQKDAWVCVPHRATDDYIKQMAQYFRDNLNNHLNIYLEYSNEVWNWQFEQTHWNAQNSPDHLSYPRAYTEKAINAFRIWHEEFGQNDKDRVLRVLGTQVGHNWVSQEILGHADADDYDYFSPTWYFGYSGAPCYDALVAGDTNTTAIDILTCTRDYFRSNFENGMRQASMNAALFGKTMVYYEGGQHMTSNPVIEPFQDSLYAAQIHPMMYDLYQEVIDSMRTINSDMAISFVLASIRESRYGSWGHLEDIDQDLSVQPAPKFQALLDNIDTLCQQIVISTRTISAELDLDVVLFPNPTMSQLNLECQSCSSQYQIAIFDATGRVIQSIQSQLPFYTFDVKDLPNGMYFLQVSDHEKIVVKKFLKL